MWMFRHVIGLVAAVSYAHLPRLTRMLGRAGRDGAHAIRVAPRTSAFAILLLAAGMAAATVTFSVVDHVVLRPLPFQDGERIVALRRRASRELLPTPEITSQDYFAWRKALTTLTPIAATSFEFLRLKQPNGVERVPATATTANLFEVLGVSPVLGRLFDESHEIEGQDRVVLISHGYWLRAFGADPAAVGQMLPFEDGPREILGVMPRGFDYPVRAGQAVPIDFWVPYAASDEDRTFESGGRCWCYQVVGRLRNGASLEQARAEVEHLAATLSPMDRSDPGWRPVVTSLRTALTDGARGWMLLALGAVGLVMLVACVNVANVLLARSAVRAREMALRTALGASRRQLAGAQVVEGMLLSAVATLIGLAVAYGGLYAIKAVLPGELPRTAAIGLDARVLLATIAAAVLTGFGYSFVPAWHSSRTNLLGVLQNGGTATAGPRHRRWGTVLLTSEIAFVTALLVATALVVGSFVRITRADLGFDRQRFVMLAVNAPAPGVTPHQVLDAVAAVAGVTHAGILSGFGPLTNTGTRTDVLVSWRTEPFSGPDVAGYLRVSPGYFQAAGLRLIRGRAFDVSSPAEMQPAIINELAAAKYFGDRDPLGETIAMRGGRESRTVIGIVSNVRREGPESEPGLEVYVPFIGAPSGTFYVAVRTAVPPERLTALLQAVVAAGIYGVMAFVVAQRTREIGVRMALGAEAGRVMRSVLSSASRHLLAGLVVGLAVAWLLSDVFAPLLFRTGPTDPVVYLVVAITLFVPGLLAALLPARRAAQVDPLTALKAE
jgi:putative ABC transport system permease protein